MIFNLFSSTIYIKVSKNKFTVKHIESNHEVTLAALEPFTTTRLLVGQFKSAEALLKGATKKAYKTNWRSSSPVVVIQPLSMTEGGLSQLEERVFYELATGAGARKVVVWVGDELTDAQVLEKVKT